MDSNNDPNNPLNNHNTSDIQFGYESDQDEAVPGPSGLQQAGSDNSISIQVNDLSLDVNVNNNPSGNSLVDQDQNQGEPARHTAAEAGASNANPFQETTAPPQNDEVSQNRFLLSQSQSQSLIPPSSPSGSRDFLDQNNKQEIPPVCTVTSTASEPDLTSQKRRKSARISNLKPVHYSAKSLSKNIILQGLKPANKKSNLGSKNIGKKPSDLTAKLFKVGGPTLSQVIRGESQDPWGRIETPKPQRPRKKRRLNHSQNSDSDSENNANGGVCLPFPPVSNADPPLRSRDSPQATTLTARGKQLMETTCRTHKQTDISGLQSALGVQTDMDTHNGTPGLPILHGFHVSTPKSFYQHDNNSLNDENDLTLAQRELVRSSISSLNTSVNMSSIVSETQGHNSVETTLDPLNDPILNSAVDNISNNTPGPQPTSPTPSVAPVLINQDNEGMGSKDALDKFREILANTKFTPVEPQSNLQKDKNKNVRFRQNQNTVIVKNPNLNLGKGGAAKVISLAPLKTWQDYIDLNTVAQNPFSLNLGNQPNIGNPPSTTLTPTTGNIVNIDNQNLPVLSLQERLDISIYSPALMVWRELRNLLGREVVLRLRQNSVEAILAENLYPNWSVSYSPPTGLISTQEQAQDVVELRRRMARMQLELNLNLLRKELKSLSDKITALKTSLAAIYRTPMASDYSLDAAIDGAIFLANRERSKAFAEICRRMSAIRVAPEESLWRDLPDFVERPARAIRPVDTVPPNSPAPANQGPRRPANRQATPRDRSRSQSRRRQDGGSPGGARGRQNRSRSARGRGRGRGRGGSRPSRDSELLQQLRRWFRDNPSEE